jgi:hypothetical protein
VRTRPSHRLTGTRKIEVLGCISGMSRDRPLPPQQTPSRSPVTVGVEQEHRRPPVLRWPRTSSSPARCGETTRNVGLPTQPRRPSSPLPRRWSPVDHLVLRRSPETACVAVGWLAPDLDRLEAAVSSNATRSGRRYQPFASTLSKPQDRVVAADGTRAGTLSHERWVAGHETLIRVADCVDAVGRGRPVRSP